MKPVDSKQALRISMDWEAQNLSLEIPNWTASIEKHFQPFNPHIEHYLDEKNPKCLTKVSWEIAKGPRDTADPVLPGIRAVYWLFFSNDGRLGCRFWGGAEAAFGDETAYAIEAAGSQRLRNKSGDWFKNLNKNHEGIAAQLTELAVTPLTVKDALWALRDSPDGGMGLRSWNLAAMLMNDSTARPAGHILATCSSAITTGYYTPWMRPAQWALCWGVLRDLSLATQQAA